MNIDCKNNLHYLWVERQVKMQHGTMMYYKCKNCPHRDNKLIENKESFKVISRC